MGENKECDEEKRPFDWIEAIHLNVIMCSNRQKTNGEGIFSHLISLLGTCILIRRTVRQTIVFSMGAFQALCCVTSDHVYEKKSDIHVDRICPLWQINRKIVLASIERRRC